MTMKLDTMTIKMQMAKQGLTGTALASLAGISRQNISTILGRGTCSVINAGKLAEGLGVPVADIIKED